MRFAFVTLGSSGDLHPMLALAREMTDRGHDVALFSQAPHLQEVVREGVRFLPVASQRDHDRTLNHPDLWHPLRGLGVLWRHLVEPSIAPTLQSLANWRGEQSDGPLIVASPLAVGARLFRDQAGVPLISVATAPTALRTVESPMFMGAWQVPDWTPKLLRQQLWSLLDRFKLEPMARPTVAKWQQKLGTSALPPQLFRDWLLSPDGVMALFPAEFCAPRGDWPHRTVQFGFPHYRPRLPQPLSRTLETFLTSGTTPWLIYPGSAHNGSTLGSRIDRLIDAIRAQGYRVVVLCNPITAPTRWQEDPAVHFEGWTDLPALIPRVRAIAHHGGIGTCAWAILHATPQLVMPSAYDQHENGWHIQAMKQGRVLANNMQQPSQISELVRELSATSSPNPRHASENAVRGAPAVRSMNVACCDWLENQYGAWQESLPGHLP